MCPSIPFLPRWGNRRCIALLGFLTLLTPLISWSEGEESDSRYGLWVVDSKQITLRELPSLESRVSVDTVRSVPVIDVDPKTGEIYTVARNGHFHRYSESGLLRATSYLHAPRGRSNRLRRVYPRLFAGAFGVDRLWVVSGRTLYGYSSQAEYAVQSKLGWRPLGIKAHQSTGVLWLHGSRYLAKIDRNGAVLTEVKIGDRHRIRQMVIDEAAGNVWLLTSRGARSFLQLVSSSGEVIRRVAVENRARAIAIDQNRGVWVLGRKGLRMYDFDGSLIVHTAGLRFRFRGLHVVADPVDGALWVGRRKSIAHYSSSGELQSTHIAERNVRQLLLESPETIEAPSINILDPVDGSLSEPRPKIEVGVSGIDPGERGSAITILFEEQPVSSICERISQRRYLCTLETSLREHQTRLTAAVEFSPGEFAESESITLILDTDGDSVPDSQDLFPNDPSESSDLDGDEIGDNADKDRDGDGVENEIDEYPDDFSRSGEPPILMITTPLEQIVQSATVLITGEARDQGSGISQMVVTNKNGPDTSYPVELNDLGAFDVDVPLSLGRNQLEVVASDGVGNVARVTLLVLRIDVPGISIQDPLNGLLTRQSDITVAGGVFSYESSEQLRVSLGDFQQFATKTEFPNQFSFEFQNVSLQEGGNQIRVSVEGAGGTSHDEVAVVRQTEVSDDSEGPVVEIFRPRQNQITNKSNISVTGRVFDPSGVAALSVNGEVVFSGAGLAASRSFSVSVAVSDVSGPIMIPVFASDQMGNETRMELNIMRDVVPPSLTLLQPDWSDDQVRKVIVSNPTRLGGSVGDPNLAGVTVNGRSVELKPEGRTGRYLFDVRYSPEPGHSTLTFEAWDLAGNLANLEYEVDYTADVHVEIQSPVDSDLVLVDGFPGFVSVTATIGGDLDVVDQVVAAFDSEAPKALTRNGAVASGLVEVLSGDDPHVLTVSVHDAVGSELARTTSRPDVSASESIDLEVVSVAPVNESQVAEPNEVVSFRFNRPVDPERLEIRLTEAATGLEQEAVSGGYSLSDDGRVAAFYPQQDFAYDADVFSVVAYDGNELFRSRFKVRSKPAFIQGIVSNQFLEPIEGVRVEMPSLGFDTVTDANGSFAFGFGLTAERVIPPGRHHVVVNRNLADRRFGSAIRFVSVDDGELNRAGLFKLPELNPEVPFRRIETGQSGVRLASSDLKLDLSEALLEFPNLRDAGDVHVQFEPLSSLSVSGLPNATPQWSYSFHPRGIKVTGSVGVEIKAPSLYGSYEYLPDNGTPVLLLGFDVASDRLMPVGVGRVEGRNVSGTADLQVLDYVAYVPVPPALYPLLEGFDRGEISLAELIGGVVKGDRRL